MTARARRLALALALPGLSLAAAAAPEPPARGLAAARLAATPSWEGPQLIRADRAGNVHLLRGDTLEVFPVGRDGALGPPRRPRRAGLVAGTVLGADLSADGGLWVLAADGGVSTFEDGLEKAVPDPGWIVVAVGALGGDVLAGVVPIQVGVSRDAPTPRVPPQVLRFDGARWSTLLEGTYAERPKDRNPADALFANHTVELAAAPDGRLWVIHPYRGRLARVGKGGTPELEIVLGDGTPAYREDGQRAQRELEERTAKQGYDPRRTTAVAFTAELAILGATVGRDNRLYLLRPPAGGAGGVAGGVLLERYDPVRSIVERVPVRLPVRGKVSLAAGKDALYVAGEHGDGGRWRISWEAIDQAAWRESPDAKVGARRTAAE